MSLVQQNVHTFMIILKEKKNPLVNGVHVGMCIWRRDVIFDPTLGGDKIPSTAPSYSKPLTDKLWVPLVVLAQDSIYDIIIRKKILQLKNRHKYTLSLFFFTIITIYNLQLISHMVPEIYDTTSSVVKGGSLMFCNKKTMGFGAREVNIQIGSATY